MANRSHFRMFISGCLLGLYISSASPLTSFGIRYPADRSTGASPSTSLGVSCSKGLCRGCGFRLDQTTRSNSLPLLILCGGGGVLPSRLSTSTVRRHIGPQLRFRPVDEQRSGAQVRDFSSNRSSSDVAMISPGSRSHSEKKRKSNWDVEDSRAGLPVGSQGREKQQFTKRFVFRTKDPTRKPQSMKLWPRQTWRNFKLGKKRLTSQVLTVKRQDRRDLLRKNSAPDNAADVAPAASPHRWAVFFIGKRPYK